MVSFYNKYIRNSIVRESGPHGVTVSAHATNIVKGERRDGRKQCFRMSWLSRILYSHGKYTKKYVCLYLADGFIFSFLTVRTFAGSHVSPCAGW